MRHFTILTRFFTLSIRSSPDIDTDTAPMTKPRDVVCVGGRLRLSSTTALAQLLHDLALQQNKQSIISIGMDGTESMKPNDTDVVVKLTLLIKFCFYFWSIPQSYNKVCVLDLVQLEDDLEVKLYF